MKMPVRDRKAWIAANKERWANYYRKWAKRNRPKINQDMREWRAQNPEHFKAWRTEYTEKNRERLRQYQRDYANKNREKINAYQTSRICFYKARMRDSTPKWANKFFISEIYDLARLRTKLTGLRWEVDHIVPLYGKRVCGLHVENNLRVIPMGTNRRKSNKLEISI